MNEVLLRQKLRTKLAPTPRRVSLVVLGCCYAVLWIGGVGQYAIGASNKDTGWLAALFLLVAGSIVLISTRGWRERGLLITVAAVGFAAEVVGVHSTIPFGSYTYTNVLGPKILSVPLVMTSAWMILTAYVKQSFVRTNPASWWYTVLGALYLTAFDLLIDPLASNQLGYWKWNSTGPYFGVPLTNFAGWLIVSVIVMALLRRRFERNWVVMLTGLSIILFFTLLAFLLGQLIIGLLGSSLCLLNVFLIRKELGRDAGLRFPNN